MTIIITIAREEGKGKTVVLGRDPELMLDATAHAANTVIKIASKRLGKTMRATREMFLFLFERIERRQNESNR